MFSFDVKQPSLADQFGILLVTELLYELVIDKLLYCWMYWLSTGYWTIIWIGWWQVTTGYRQVIVCTNYWQVTVLLYVLVIDKLINYYMNWLLTSYCIIVFTGYRQVIVLLYELVIVLIIDKLLYRLLRSYMYWLSTRYCTGYRQVTYVDS